MIIETILYLELCQSLFEILLIPCNDRYVCAAFCKKDSEFETKAS